MRVFASVFSGSRRAWPIPRKPIFITISIPGNWAEEYGHNGLNIVKSRKRKTVRKASDRKSAFVKLQGNRQVSSSHIQMTSSRKGSMTMLTEVARLVPTVYLRHVNSFPRNQESTLGVPRESYFQNSTSQVMPCLKAAVFQRWKKKKKNPCEQLLSHQLFEKSNSPLQKAALSQESESSWTSTSSRRFIYVKKKSRR